MMTDNNKGFTLIEILVVIAVASIVLTGIYSTYLHQERSYRTQTQLVATQQTLRATMFIMGREIRMAGLDTSGTSPSLHDEDEWDARSGSFKFRKEDKDKDGNKVILTITYDVSDGKLRRTEDDDTPQLIAANIDALNFVYLDGSNPPNNVDADDDGILDSTEIDNVRVVEITVVARTAKQDIHYTDTQNYENLQGEVILGMQNDHFRRRVLSERIHCRNLSL